MPINEPRITAECDVCFVETDPMELTMLAGGAWDDRNVKPTLIKWGWKVDGERTVCEECKEEDADAAPQS